VYYNLINITQSWVTTGRATFGGVMVALHGGVFVLSMLWLAKQHNNWSLPRFGRRASGAAQQ